MARRLKRKVKMTFILILALLSLIGVIYSVYHIIEWKLDGDKINDIIDNIEEKVNIKDVDEDNNENIVTVEQPEEIPQDNPYWKYLKMSLINVDFDDLININKETVGWISINGTNINYPYVQTSDNKYYLTHDFEKNYNTAGWVFLDYRNNADLSNKNTIIYAHGRYDKTMFGTLRNALTNGWLSNTDNYVFKISTPNENSLWQVFSIYHIPATNDYLKIDFGNDEEYSKFIKLITDRSAHKFNTNVSANDKIITLSTCYNETERVVLHAKLIKYEKKY